MTKILIIDDEPGMVQSLCALLKKREYETVGFTHPVSALNALRRECVDIVLTDLRMPGVDGLEMIERIQELCPQAKIILMTAYSSIPNAVEAMKKGADEYIPKPFELEALEEKIRGLGAKKRRVSRESDAREYELLGVSGSMQRIRDQITKMGKTHATVLIRGESGVGKELVARQLHYQSTRKDGPFLPINMAAIPETLMESELFGYRKGSFTGADEDSEGKFLASKGGTLFLDEVSEMPLNFQAKMLRVLQEFQILPLGASQPLRVDCRVLAATNRDIEEYCREKKFREDLYFRLNTLEIIVPPLRERMEDLPILVSHFLNIHGTSETRIPENLMDVLRSYKWPGNVRELENIIHRCVVLAESEELDIRDLPEHISGLPPRKETPLAEIAYRQLREGKSLADLEQEIILKSIDASRGNKTQAAKVLKITRRKLYSRLEKHGIKI
ncbi:sigma-54-dependent Fis family transcriptional regulator [bacterium]|jgi:DNA-binding NtrC family response regulator|nr:sigma-54-dependent Fis family transcriptional regulator [bacterium]